MLLLQTLIIFILKNRKEKLKMNKKRFSTILCVLLIAGIANAQQQASKNEAKNAAINMLYNKANVLNRSSDTEIDTIHGFSNSRSNVLMYEVVFKNRTAILLSGSKACLPVLGYYIKLDNDNQSNKNRKNNY